MTDKRIKQLLREAHQENINDLFSQKLILIEDIIRVKKLLFGLGEIIHNEFTNDDAAGKLFDTLYELDNSALELILHDYSVLATEKAREKAKLINI